ncbi:MAG: MarR family winged helix-turn-helix transcriptional regulator [Rhizomicrobium sp.]
MARETSSAALAEALRGFIGNLKRRLRAQSHAGDLSWSHLSMLGRLEREGPSTVTVIARAEGVRPQSMGATMAGLEEAGLVESAPDPDDGRQTLWKVTPKCREIVKAARAARQDWLLAAIRKNFSQAEQDELARAVKLLERIVAEP